MKKGLCKIMAIALTVAMSLSIISCNQSKNPEEVDVYEVTCPLDGETQEITQNDITAGFYICEKSGKKVMLTDEMKNAIESALSDSSEVKSDAVSTENSGISQDSQTTSSTVVNNPSNIENNVYLSGFPLVKNKVEINILTYKELGEGDVNTMKFTRDYEAKTNVKIKWKVVAAAQRISQTELMLQSKSYPDIYSFGEFMTEGKIAEYGDRDGVFYNIEPLIKKWAPNAYKFMQDNPAARKVVTRPNGQIYALPAIYGENYSNSWIIRKSWLSDVGLSVPKTTDELRVVLKAFKQRDPDCIPISVAYEPALFRPWGLDLSWHNRCMSVDKNGNAKYAMTTQNFQEGVKFWTSLYTEDLMDKNVFKSLNPLPAVKTGKVGVSKLLWLEALDNDKLASDYITMPEPKGNYLGNFSGPHSEVYPGFSSGGFYFFKTNKNIEASLRWADFFFTPQGHMYKTYGGEPGKYYQKIGSQFKVSADVLKSGSYKIDSPFYTLQAGYHYLPDEFAVKVNSSTLTEEAKRLSIFVQERQKILDSQKPEIKNIITQSIPMTIQEAKIKTKYEVDANPIWNSFRWAETIITGGSLPADGINMISDWNGYVNELNRLGAKEYEVSLNSAYQRFRK